jgi:hypothetical protein
MLRSLRAAPPNVSVQKTEREDFDARFFSRLLEALYALLDACAGAHTGTETRIRGRGPASSIGPGQYVHLSRDWKSRASGPIISMPRVNLLDHLKEKVNSRSNSG